MSCAGSCRVLGPAGLRAAPPRQRRGKEASEKAACVRRRGGGRECAAASPPAARPAPAAAPPPRHRGPPASPRPACAPGPLPSLHCCCNALPPFRARETRFVPSPPGCHSPPRGTSNPPQSQGLGVLQRRGAWGQLHLAATSVRLGCRRLSLTKSFHRPADGSSAPDRGTAPTGSSPAPPPPPTRVVPGGLALAWGQPSASTDPESPRLTAGGSASCSRGHLTSGGPSLAGSLLLSTRPGSPQEHDGQAQAVPQLLPAQAGKEGELLFCRMWRHPWGDDTGSLPTTAISILLHQIVKRLQIS